MNSDNEIAQLAHAQHKSQRRARHSRDNRNDQSRNEENRDGKVIVAVAASQTCGNSTGDEGAIPPVPPGPMAPIRGVLRTITPVAQRGDGGRWLRGSPSPNPAGRPAVQVEVKEAARAHTLDAIGTLARVMLDESTPPAAQVAAAIAMLDRGWGKPVASIESKVATVDMTALHLDALKSLSSTNRTNGSR